MIKRTAIGTLTLLALLLGPGVVRRAAAASVGGPVTQVEYHSNPSNPTIPLLMLELNGSNTIYYGQTTTPGCSLPAPSIDTIKIWSSLAQASLLSGKTVTVYYNVCGPNNFVYDLVLQH